MRYDGIDAPMAPAGEVSYEPYLARSWQNFALLYADGFEKWLDLYRPLLDAAILEDAA
jgi:exodeoxyribonuclease V gamma subunit